MDAPQILSSSADIPKGAKKLDVFDNALRELYFIEHPTAKKGAHDEELKEYIARSTVERVWVYYPWKRLAVCIPEQRVFERLRSARNRDLITESEQAAYRGSCVGIAGLSVGSSAALALVLTSGPRRLKVADPDTIEITNLNRMNAGLPDLSHKKTEVFAQRAWELDPFLAIEIFDEGVNEANATRFLTEAPLTVFVDEMDDIAMKVHMRHLCQQKGIPVVMATDNGDGVILDVERFDEEPQRPLFHGRVHFSPDELKNIDRETFVRLANEIIDTAQFSKRQLASIQAIGKSLSGVPQLATAAMVSGAAAAYAVRRIALGESMPSGRYVVDFERAIA